MPPTEQLRLEGELGCATTRPRSHDSIAGNPAQLAVLAVTPSPNVTQRGAPATGTGATAAAGSKPNVLVLFADDLGFNQLNLQGGQPYGYSGVGGAIKTPHLAKFAAEGTTFMHWYSGFHVCTPSRASIMTGRLPVRVGLGDGVLSASAVGGLQHNETTVARDSGTPRRSYR